MWVYLKGQPADYFILILEGRVEILVGKEKLNFEAGPFHQFGADFLMTESAKESKVLISNKYTSEEMPKMKCQ